MLDQPATLAVPAIAALLLGCGRSAPEQSPRPAPAVHASDAAASPTAPAPVPRDARLVVLEVGSKLRFLDAYDRAAPPERVVDADGAEQILDVAADGRVLLGDHFHSERQRVLLVDARGTHVLADDRVSRPTRFLPDGRILMHGQATHSSCGGVVREPFARIAGPAGESVREIPGSVQGAGADGRRLLLEQPVEGACRPAGGRTPAAPRHVLADPDDGRTAPAGDPLVLGFAGPTSIVATLEVTGHGALERGRCTLVTGGKRHAIEGASCQSRSLTVSPDGRWVAASTTDGAEAALRVYRTSDGALAAQHPGGAPLGTIGIGPPAVGACFSPDGERLVIARADLEVIATRPEGGDVRRLGQGGCVEFSPDGRFLLLTGTGGNVSFRIVDAERWITNTLERALGARFLPAASGGSGGR